MYSVSKTRKLSKTPEHQEKVRGRAVSGCSWTRRSHGSLESACNICCKVRPLTVLREGLVSLPPARVPPGGGCRTCPICGDVSGAQGLEGRDHERALLVGSGLSF